MWRFPVIVGLFFAASFPANVKADQQAEAVAAIKKLGGTVRPVSRNGEGWEVEFHLFGRALTDDGLVRVAELKNLVWLNLRDTKITSAGLVHLKSLASLQRLHLERTKIGDIGIANLEYLNLYATNVTDKSLSHLTRLKKLKRLYVWKTKVTVKGAAKLQQALPELRIVHGVDLSQLPAKEVRKPRTKPVPLKWIVTSDKKPPKSKLGSGTTVTFENKMKRTVKVYWIGYGGQYKLYAKLAAGSTRRQNSFSDATWLITDENDVPLGYFITRPVEESLAVIPRQK